MQSEHTSNPFLITQHIKDPHNDPNFKIQSTAT
jgi:hypothetical protein